MRGGIFHRPYDLRRSFILLPRFAGSAKMRLNTTLVRFKILHLLMRILVCTDKRSTLSRARTDMWPRKIPQLHATVDRNGNADLLEAKNMLQ